jgi:hypothetical protein
MNAKAPASAAAVLAALGALAGAGDDANAPDLCRGPVDPYHAGAERGRFFAAAGVDNELDAKEFQADRRRSDPFAKPFDRWERLAAFDRNRNETLDWFEADAYRLDLRRRILAAYDKNRDRRLSGEERRRANRALAAGRLPKPDAPGDANAPPRYRPDYEQLRRQADRDGDGRLSGEEIARLADLARDHRRRWQMTHFDADGDGNLSPDEREAMAGHFRRRSEQRHREAMAEWDTDGDGELSDAERRGAGDRRRRRFAAWRRRAMARWDADGDGNLSAEERAAVAEHFRRRSEQRRREVMARWDADGDGRLSSAEKEALAADRRRRRQQRRQEMDTDGDGRVSDDERRAYWRKRMARRAAAAGLDQPE